MLEKIITQLKQHPILTKGIERGAMIGYGLVTPITMILSDLVHHYESLTTSILESFHPEFLPYSLFYTSASTITGGLIGHLWDKSIKIEKEKNLEIKKNTKMFNDFFNESSTGFHIFNPNGTFININNYELNMIGYTREEIIGKMSWKDIIISKNYLQFEKHLADINNPEIGIVKDLEYTLIHKDKHHIKVLLNASGKFNKDGKLINTRGNLIDITQQKINEEKIKNLEKAIEQSPISVVITDSNGKIEYVNLGFIKTTGYSLEEVLGQNPRILNSGKTPCLEFTQLWQTIILKKTWNGEFSNKKKDGSEYQELVSISPVLNLKNEITHYIKIGEDITKRKKTEEILKEFKNDTNNQLTLARQMIEEELPKNNQKLFFCEIAYSFEPMIKIGGDILNYYQLNKNELLFTMADVSGHGIAAAILASKYNSSFEKTVTSYFEMENDPDKYSKSLENPNRYLNEKMREFNNAIFNKSGGMYITGQLGHINHNKRELCLIDAGHTPLIHFKKKDNLTKRYENAKKHNKFPLGWLKESTIDLKENINRTRKINYDSEDIFVLYSDGIFETQNKDKKMFGLNKLEELIHYYSELAPTEIVKKINEEVEIFRGENVEIEDDMTLMIMKMK